MLRTFVAVGLLVLASGCDTGGGAPETAGTGLGAAPPYRAVTDIRQTMEWILDPAADVIWGSAGFVITAEGETDLSPTTAAGWDRVRNASAALAEAGNLLMMPGRSQGADWDAWSRALTTGGERAIAAAQARDPAALFEAGGELYQACRSCHARYMPGARDAE